jgi:hypothetical protein
MGLAASIDLRGRRKLSCRVSAQAKAGHGRDTDISGGHGGDTGLGEDRVVAGTGKLNGDLDRVLIYQATLNTSDGLGVCRTRKEEGEAAIVGTSWFEELTKARTCVKSI